MLQFAMTNRNHLERGTKITCNEAQLHLKSRTKTTTKANQPPIEQRRCFLPPALWVLHDILTAITDIPLWRPFLCRHIVTRILRSVPNGAEHKKTVVICIDKCPVMPKSASRHANQPTTDCLYAVSTTAYHLSSC
jgi:hypothetical protein